MLDKNLFWNIPNVIALFAEWIVIYISFNCLSKSKQPAMIRYSMLLVMTLVGLLLNALSVLPNIKVILGVFMSLIFYKFNYEVSLAKSIFVISIFWMILLGIEASTMSVIMAINSLDSVHEILVNNLYRLETIIISKGLLIVLLLIFRNYKINIEMKKMDLIYISIPIVTNIISLITVFNYNLDGNNNMIINKISVFVISVLILVSNIALIMLVGKIVKENKLRLENEFIKEKMKMQYDYYESIKERQFRTRQLYHDMKNHLLCIEQLGNSEDAKRYINSIKNEILELENNFDSGNIVLDIILDEKNSVCREKNINFVAHIDASKMNFIEDVDICSIFSNAINNSIEACENIYSNSKYISIVSTYVKNFCVIKIENSKLNEIYIEEGKIKTSKKDDFIHGIGIESIKHTVSKYNGEVIIDYSTNKFILKIMLPLGKNLNEAI